MIISKCLCKCYIKWDDNTEMFMWMLHNEMIMEKCLCECYIMRRLHGNVYVNVT
jgi:hypothetical protein